jgi:hypothetical protein
MTINELFLKYEYSIEKKLDTFEKYVSRQSMSRFMARFELFKKIKNIRGNIVECGVHHGGGLMTWAKLSTILEPYAIYRHIIGFDTFEGFPAFHEKDKSDWKNNNLKKGGLKTSYDVYSELQELIALYDGNRYLNKLPKIELVKGNAIDTIPVYAEKNPQMVISLLYLDFDLYEPTKVALEYFLPKVPKGGIVVFDEMNNKLWPGETTAVLEKFGNFNKLKIEQFDYEPKLSYMVMD